MTTYERWVPGLLRRTTLCVWCGRPLHGGDLFAWVGDPSNPYPAHAMCEIDHQHAITANRYKW